MSPPPIPSPIYEDYARCIRCGLCLNACPTYRLWNLEADSPRGRLHQMIHVELDQQPITDSFVDHIDKCLDCRACETACPSAVEYGKLVEHGRARIERDYPRSWRARVTRNFVFRHLLPDPHRIIDAARVLRFYQRSGLQAIARSIGVLKLLGLAERERLLPRIDDDFFFRRLGWTFPASGPRRARVAFFAGCVANITFSQLNEATIRVLTANGCEVLVPDGSSAAALSRRTPPLARPPANSRERISPSFFAKTSTPSSPTPPAAAPRSRNTIISSRKARKSTARHANLPPRLVTSPNSSPLSASPQN